MGHWVTELPKYVVYMVIEGGFLGEWGKLGDGILEPVECDHS